MIYSKELGEKISEEYRKRLDKYTNHHLVTKTSLAKAIGVSILTLDRFLNHKLVTIKTLNKIGGFLDNIESKNREQE